MSVRVDRFAPIAVLALTIASSTGTGALTLVTQVAIANDVLFAVGDFNGDQLDDAIVSTSGTLRAVMHERSGLVVGPVFMTAPVAIKGLATGDMNGDGKVDFVVAQSGSPSSVVVWINQGGGTFRQGASIATSHLNGKTRLADLNGDRMLDVMAIGTDAIHVHLNLGDGTIGDTMLFSSNAPKSIEAGDFNGDGLGDMVVGASGLPAEVFHNRVKR